MFRSKTMVVILAAVFAISMSVIVGAGSSIAASQVRLTFAGGPSGGTWNILSAAVSELIKNEIPGSSVTVVPGGSTANLAMVSRGDADIGLCHPFVAALGKNGEEPFKKPITNVRAVAKAYPVWWQFTVLQKLPVSSFKELKEKKYPIRICVLTKGNLGEILTRKVLAGAGISYDDIVSWGGKVTFTGYPDAINLITDGHADGLIPLMSWPAAVIMQLEQTRPIKQFSVDDKTLEQLAGFGLGRGVIPAGTYKGMDKDTVTIEAPNMLIARDDVPEDVIYSVTKAYVESRDKLAKTVTKALGTYPLNDLCNGLGVALHPGSERYYKERGFLK